VKETYPDIIPRDSDGTQYATLVGGWIASHSDYVAVDGVSANGMWGGKKNDLYTVVVKLFCNTCG